jgi:hypothetical protein
MDSRLSIGITAAIGVLLIWLAFSSTGGGGSSSPAGGNPASSSTPPPSAQQPSGTSQVADRSSIEDLLTRTYTENDPRQCTRDMTRAFLRQSFGSESGTLDRCRRRNTPQSEVMAKSIEVHSVGASGSKATAMIRLSSTNTLDGSTMTLSLAREGGHWKLNKLVDVQIDRPRFDQHLRDELGSRGYLPAETSCAVAKLDQSVSDAEIERDVIIASSSYEYIQSAAVSCLSRPTLIRELRREFSAVLSSRGFPPRVTRCVVDKLTRGLPIARLRHLLAAGSRSAEAWFKLGYQATLDCTGGGTTNATQSATT